MSDNFVGFSEADIKRIVGSAKVHPEVKEFRNGAGVAKRPLREAQQRRFVMKRNVNRDHRMLNGDRKPSNTLPPHAIPKEARLFIPQILEQEEEEDEDENKPESDKAGTMRSQQEEVGLGQQHSVLKSQSIEISASKLLKSNKSVLITESGEDGSSGHTCPPEDGLDIDALTKFQQKQKQMEEQNRQRKELLQRALADRTKKTREEARRLNQIEEELKKLDAMLSNDVSIIRNQIEVASHDFMEAQKRYDKAERDFLEAKLCLFNHKERKEMLTSHLCTIIEQNEIRKAKKLSHLMEKLQMGVDTSATPAPKQKVKESQQQQQQVGGDKKENHTAKSP